MRDNNSIKGGTEKTALNQKKRVRKKKIRTNLRKFFVTLMLLLAVLLGVLFTPAFNISQILVKGIAVLKEEKILSLVKSKKGDNIFTFDLKNTTAEISKIPYVEYCEISRKLPSTVEINIVERVPIAYVKVAEEYAIIDKNGMILEKAPNMDMLKIPLASTPIIVSTKVGEKISSTEDKNFQNILELASQMYDNRIGYNLDEIYIDNDCLTVAINNKNLKVLFGTEEKLSYKIRFLNEIYSNIPQGSEGVIDLKSGEKGIFKSAK